MKKANIRIFVAGDSTVASYPANQAPMAGWGQMLGLFFSDEVEIRNEARCGKSSKSFIHEGWLKQILEEIAEKDYLLVQFGHNDEKPNGTEPFTTFQEYLAQYITGARQKGAIPVLVTPVHRRHFGDDGRLKNTHGDYPAAMKQLANALQVPLIDLWARTETLYQSLGPEASKRLFVWLAPNENSNYPEGVQDNTHFHECGAKEVAKLAVDEIVKLHLPLAAYVDLRANEE